MKIHSSILCFIWIFALCGCEPKPRVQWSPDGSRAAVLIDFQMHITDAEGDLIAALADRDEDPGRLFVEGFDWLADGAALVVHRIRIAPQWQQIRQLLLPVDAQRVEALAAKMPAMLAAAVALHGDADRPELLLAKLAPQEVNAMGNAFRLALVNDAEAVTKALSGAPRALASLNTANDEETGFVLHELALVRLGADGGVQATQALSRGLQTIESVRVSPQFPVLVAARQTANRKRFALEILALDGTFRADFGDTISSAYAWTPDGLGLVYLEPFPSEEGTVMKLRRSVVLDAKGQALAPLSERGPIPTESEDLALAIVPFSPRVAVLPDGSVLFASQALAFPVLGEDLPLQPRLYIVSADGAQVRAVATAEGALPMDLGYFVLSPQGGRVALVESETDAVAVIDLQTGKSTLVSEPHPDWKSRTLPAWRSEHELSFAALDPETGTVQWLLWSDDGKAETKHLSSTWPHGATDRWLEKKENSPAETKTP